MENKKDKIYSFPQVGIRLVKESTILSETPITKSLDAVALMQKFLCDMDREYLCVVNLKADMTPINFSVVSIGTITQAMYAVAEVFKSAILSNSPRLIILHSHPSGSLTPSKEDCMATDRLAQAGKLLEIEVVDHVIIGPSGNRYYSFAENKILNAGSLYLANTKEAASHALNMVAERE